MNIPFRTLSKVITLILGLSFVLVNTAWAMGYPQSVISLATASKATAAKEASGKRPRPEYSEAQAHDSMTRFKGCPRPVNCRSFAGVESQRDGSLVSNLE